MKVGIIGGGIAGLMASWLLEEECEVILLEQRNRLGGHAHTAYIEIMGNQIPIETGFEFFNQPMFPYFWRLLQILEIPTCSYPFTYSFTHQQSTYILPPMQGNKIFWRSCAPSQLSNMLQLKYLINASYLLVQDKDTSLTLDQFTKNLWLTDSFKHRFFFPLFSAGWGVCAEEFRSFSAYNILSWIIKNRAMGMQTTYWHEVVDGMTSYIQKLHAQITQAQIHTEVRIEKIMYDADKYRIFQTNGTVWEVDHLILATNAYQARKLLEPVPHAGQLRTILSMVDYIRATIAVHSDCRFMPRHVDNWSIANVQARATYSALTIYKKWKSQVPLFRSWLVPEFPEPSLLYDVQEYYHAKPNLNYHKAQQQIEPLQGNNKIWLTGIYTRDIDSHESALVSAVSVAQRLQPQSKRLAFLCNGFSR
jgi:predicted NAD/FAD-binding protein